MTFFNNLYRETYSKRQRDLNVAAARLWLLGLLLAPSFGSMACDGAKLWTTSRQTNASPVVESSMDPATPASPPLPTDEHDAETPAPTTPVFAGFLVAMATALAGIAAADRHKRRRPLGLGEHLQQLAEVLTRDLHMDGVDWEAVLSRPWSRTLIPNDVALLAERQVRQMLTVDPQLGLTPAGLSSGTVFQVAVVGAAAALATAGIRRDWTIGGDLGDVALLALLALGALGFLCGAAMSRRLSNDWLANAGDDKDADLAAGGEDHDRGHADRDEGS